MAKPRKRRAPDPLLLLSDSLTVFLLLTGSLAGFVTAYGVEAPLWPLLVCFVPAALLAALVWSQPGGGKIAAAAIVLWAFFSWSFRREVVQVLAYLLDRILGLEPVYLLEYITAVQANLLPVLILFVTVALALLLGWLTVQARCWFLAALPVWMPLAPALLRGVLPNWWTLLAGTLGWGTLLLTSLFSSGGRRSLGRASLLCQGGLAALLLVLTLALPRENYTRPQWATDARGELMSLAADALADVPPPGGEDSAFSQWAERMGFRFGSAAPDTGDALRELDLTGAGPRRASGDTVLAVRSTQSSPAGRVYLKGFSAGLYAGDRWAVLDEPDGDSWPDPAYWPALTAPEATVSAMTIHHVQEGGTAAYIPYRLQSLPEWGVSLTSGGVERNPQAGTYQILYIPGGPVDGYVPINPALLSSVYSETQRPYRDFVYQQYLQVPEAAARALTPLLALMEGEDIVWPEDFPEEHREAVAAARRTAALLSSLAIYDLDVPAMEEGEDFAAYFLEEGRGYCVHFATAGALLLRLEGVPTRYVSGYVADLDSQGNGVSRDSDAHAWVEIYLDGYGWYPVEMTPGFRETAGSGVDGLVSLPVGGAEADDSTDVPLPEDELFPPVPELLRPDGQPEEDGAGDALTDQGEGAGGGLKLTWLRWAAVLALAAAAVFVLYRAAMGYRKREREQSDTNRAAIAAYRRYCRLLRWGREEDEVLENLARKARFSQHRLTPAEREEAWKRLESVVWRTRLLLPGWRRWCFLLLRPIF